VVLFLLCSGISLQLSSSHKSVSNIITRALKLALVALLISISTYILFPTRWIYFGTIHCISLSAILAIPFIKRIKFSPIVAILLIILPLIWKNTLFWPELSHKSMDYIPIIPWFAYFLFGMYLASIKNHLVKLNFISSSLKTAKLNTILELMGKKSLWIYLLHQPIIYGIILGINTYF